MTPNKIHKSSAPQEEVPVKTLSFIQSIIKKKLNGFYADYVEDLTQNVFLKLFKWKASKSELVLSEEEWLKIANVATHNEVKSFYSHKNRREVATEEEELNTLKNETEIAENEGNLNVKLNSLLLPLWETCQKLPTRQKYSFLLNNDNFIIELLFNKCCSIREIADSLNMSESEFTLILEKIPLSDEEIQETLTKKLKEEVSLRVIWSARNKAKTKLIQTLKGDK